MNAKFRRVLGCILVAPVVIVILASVLINLVENPHSGTILVLLTLFGIGVYLLNE